MVSETSAECPDCGGVGGVEPEFGFTLCACAGDCPECDGEGLAYIRTGGSGTCAVLAPCEACRPVCWLSEEAP